MRRVLLFVIPAGIIFVAGAGFGFIFNNWLFAGDGEASEEISAPTLDPNVTPTPSVQLLSTQNAGLQLQVDALSTQVAGGIAEAQIDATEEVVVADDSSEAQSTLGRINYRIATDESEVRFLIDEVLNGAPFTAIARTNEVAGDIVIDFDNPSSSQLGTVRVNVRTLETTDARRNDAIRSRILESAQDQYEFAEFTPTAIVGLPASVAVGDVVTFQITGDLNLHGVTNSVTFDVTVTIVSPDRIEGLASATVLYADYNISVPRVPQVSNVDDDVILEIEFVALAVTE